MSRTVRDYNELAHFARTRPGLRLAFVAGCLAALGVSATACDKGTSIGARPEGAAAVGADRTVTSSALMQKGGLCDENRRISNPEKDSPEWVVWRIYQLALGEDTDANFRAFADLFPASRNQRELKEMYWSRLRNSVEKFTVEPGKPDYVICRSIATSDGRKYYINTSDPRQTPPPVTVGEADGRNKVLFLTPF